MSATADVLREEIAIHLDALAAKVRAGETAIHYGLHSGTDFIPVRGGEAIEKTRSSRAEYSFEHAGTKAVLVITESAP